MTDPIWGKRGPPRAVRKGTPDGPPVWLPCGYCKGSGKVLCQPYKRTKSKEK
jgi:hypothetical protein